MSFNVSKDKSSQVLLIIVKNGANRYVLLKEQLSFKLKSDVFDGNVPLRKAFSQFNFVTMHLENASFPTFTNQKTAEL